MNTYSRPQIQSARNIQLKSTISAIAFGLISLSIAPGFAETIETPSIPGVAAPTCAEGSQVALNACSAQWSRTADFFRSLIYEELFWRVSEPAQTQLLTTEQAWNSFRETYCLELSEGVRGGSMYPLVYHSCRARVTNDRIADLQRLSDPESSTKTAMQRLSTLINQSNLNNAPSQRLWRRYQTLHCQFEEASDRSEMNAQSPSTPSAIQQIKSCHGRLAIARIRQVEVMQFHQ